MGSTARSGLAVSFLLLFVHVSAASAVGASSSPGSSAVVHECIHDELDEQTEEYMKLSEDYYIAEAKRTGIPDVVPEAAAKPSTIRITAEYQLSGSSSASQQKAKALTQRAILVLQKFFKVNYPSTTPITAKTLTKCNAATIPAKLTTGSGYSGTDYVVLVTSVLDTPCQGTVIAYAGACWFGPSSVGGRPVVGSINICPKVLEASDTDKFVATLVHEFIHALGFSAAVMKRRFLASSGQKYDPSFWQEVEFMEHSALRVAAGPQSLRRAKEYFKCGDAPGAPLEDGDAGSHWEMSLLNNDVMSPILSNNQRMSQFTLALMQDSGWYSPRWQFVQWLSSPLQPSDLGCDLLGRTCDSYKEGHPDQRFFCDAPSYRQAPSLCWRSSQRAYCETFDKFINPGCGGMLTFSTGVLRYDCTLEGTNRTQDMNGNDAGYYLGPGLSLGSGHSCRLFSVLDSTSGERETRSGCFDFRCESNKVYLYELGRASTTKAYVTKKVECPAGKTISLNSLGVSWTSEPSIVCPSLASVCGVSSNCGSQRCVNGYCIKTSAGKDACVCDMEWAGKDCATPISRVKDFDDASLY